MPHPLSLLLGPALAATSLVAPATQAHDDTGTTAQGASVVLSPLANDDVARGARLRPRTQAFPGEGPVLIVPGEGFWTLERGGRVKFTALLTFAGAATPVTYEVRDSAGTRTTASISVQVTPSDAWQDVTLPIGDTDGRQDGGPLSGRRLGYLAGSLLVSLGFLLLRRSRSDG